MGSRRALLLGTVVCALGLLASRAEAGQWVNVKAQWCGNTCSEGHDDAACLCEYQQGQSPYSSSSWNSCQGVSCCAYGTAICSVGEPGCSCELEDGGDPGHMRQWCFPSAPMVTCTKPYTSGTYSCSYNCMYEEECYISYPTSSPNWIYINDTAGLQCTGENETGFWSWAAFWSFISGADTCHLGQQSPWDDYPLENEVCE